MGFDLFDRVYEVRLTSKGKVRQFPGLRVEFQIEMGSGFNPNTCNLKITGLDKSDREMAIKRGTSLELYAGYRDAGAPLLYKGSVLFGQMERPGPDWVVALESVDGFASSPTVLKFPKGTPQTDLIEKFRQLAGADKGPMKDAPQGLLETAKVYAGTLSGIVQGYSKEHGLEMSIQNGALQHYAAGGHTGEGMIVLEVGSGMEGSPSRTKAGIGNMVFAAPGINVACRLNAGTRAGIRPGRRIQVKSQVVSGIFRVVKVRHNGDSHGGSWTTEVEALG